MHIIIRTLLPLLILGVSAHFASKVLKSRPEAVRLEQPRPRLAVEGMRVAAGDFRVVVESQGTVQPRVASTLVTEVSGVVRKVSPSLRAGGFFEKGEVLVEIDATNYKLDLTAAEARVAQARASLEQELAQAEVVAEDWKRLGREAPALGLRKPQIAAARAELAAAEAALERARVDLDRTRVRAPYAGRARELAIDIGQFVNTGTTAARIYATDAVEVRLPVAPDDVPFLELPEQFRATTRGEEEIREVLPRVDLQAQLGPETQIWTGVLTRVESAFDELSRQLYVIAEVADPYRNRTDGSPPLRVGQFVTAKVEGRELQKVFVLPRVALRDNAEVLVVSPAGLIERRPVRVLWSSEAEAVIDRGLKDGEIVSLTRIDVVSEGTAVEVHLSGEEGSPVALDETDATARVEAVPIRPGGDAAL